MGYHDCLKCGWKTGIHDVRGVRYQHPWLVLHRPSWSAFGCWTRAQAREFLRKLRAGGHPWET